MNKPVIAIIAAIFALQMPALAQDQKKPWTESELDEEKVVILKERENELPTATRSFKKISPESPQNSSDSLSYSVSEPTAPLQPLEAKMRVVKVKSASPVPYYTRYVKAGIGNYVSPLLEARLSSAQAGPYFYHVQLVHNSAARGAVDGGRSSYGNTGLAGHARYMTKAVGANLNAFYNYDRYNFYGYPSSAEKPSKNDIKQAYNRFGLSGELARLNTENYQAGANIGAGRTSSSLNLAESRVELGGKIRYDVGDLLSLNIGIASLFSSFNQFDESTSRNLIKIQPGFQTEYGSFKISGGFNFILDNDSDNNTELRFYPMAKAEIQPIAGLKLYGGIDGDVLPITYDQLSRENPWLGDSVTIRFTRKTFGFNGGATTTLSGIALHAGFEVATLKNHYFFVNDSSQQEQFQLVYDAENITRLSFRTQASYSYRNKWTVEGDLKLLNYTTNELQEAYHIPTLDFNSKFSINIYDKIYVNTALNVLSGIKAKNYPLAGTGDPSSIDLDPVVKLDLGGEYRFSPQATGFILFNNLLNRSDSRFLHYPSRKIVIQIGGTYAF